MTRPATPEKRKPGRPPLPKGEARLTRLTIRVRKALAQRLKARAKELEMSPTKLASDILEQALPAGGPRSTRHAEGPV